MLILQIDQSVIIALISVLGGILPVGITYVFTKNKEVNATIREEKTKRYDDLIEALAKIANVVHISKPKSIVDHNELLVNVLNNFITAYHRASTYADDLVLQRCNELASEITKQKETHEAYANALVDHIRDVYEAIRLDINPKAKYSKVAALWTIEDAIVENKDDESSGSPIK